MSFKTINYKPLHYLLYLKCMGIQIGLSDLDKLTIGIKNQKMVEKNNFKIK